MFRNYELILRFIDILFIYGIINNTVGRSGSKRVHVWDDYWIVNWKGSVRNRSWRNVSFFSSSIFACRNWKMSWNSESAQSVFRLFFELGTSKIFDRGIPQTCDRHSVGFNYFYLALWTANYFIWAIYFKSGVSPYSHFEIYYFNMFKIKICVTDVQRFVSYLTESTVPFA
jgi:hypothetical protein